MDVCAATLIFYIYALDIYRQIKESFGFTNYQEIQVQEGNIASLGSSSKAVTVILQDDLADSCHIGGVWRFSHCSTLVIQLLNICFEYDPVYSW